MFNENKKRVIQVAVKNIIELPENISDDEVERLLEEKYKGKEYQWCDEYQDAFGEFWHWKAGLIGGRWLNVREKSVWNYAYG